MHINKFCLKKKEEEEEGEEGEGGEGEDKELPIPQYPPQDGSTEASHLLQETRSLYLVEGHSASTDGCFTWKHWDSRKSESHKRRARSF